MAPGHGAPPEDDAELEVGRVGRAHGLLGEVRVDLWSDPSRLEPGSVLNSDRGPLTVESARWHGGAHLVRFEAVADRTGAESLRGLLLRARPLSVPGTLWVHELIGATVTTTDGTLLGVVAAVEANPASDLLVLESGGLVPLRFVVHHEPGAPVVVDIPEGLLD